MTTRHKRLHFLEFDSWRTHKSVAKVGMIMCLTTLFACGTSEAPPAAPQLKVKEKDTSTSLSDGKGSNDSFPDFGTMGKANSAASIRSAKKSQLMQEVGMLESDMSTARSFATSLKTQITSNVLPKGLPNGNSPTFWGSILIAGGDFVTAFMVSGVGSSGSSESPGSSNGMGGGLTTPLIGGFKALGQAVSVAITKDENGKTIKKITGSIEAQIAYYEAEVTNLQAQIDQKNGEINQLILLGTR